MTPKEKANELIEEYLSLNDNFNKPIITDEQDAVKCAIVAVDEILKAIPMYTGNLNPTWKFYNEVKQQLENEL